jgi:hypothetical protein
MGAYEIKVINNAQTLIHGALSWNSIQQQCFNDLAVGSTHQFNVGQGWHDLTILMGSKEHKFNENDNNKINIGRLLLQGLTIAVPGAGIALWGITMSVDPIAGTDLLRIGTRPTGAKEQDWNVKITAAPNVKVFPVVVTQLFAPHGYDITITGGEMTAKRDKAANTLLVTEVKPLHLHWKNTTNGNSGDVVAPTS